VLIVTNPQKQRVDVDAKIDYLSFTLMTDVRGAGDERAQGYAAVDALFAAFPAFENLAQQLTHWQGGGARGHYGLSLFQPETFISIRFGGHSNHILVELPGTGCQFARDTKNMDALLSETAHRLTRLDLAVDIPNGCAPGEFVAAGYNGRFKGRATITSAEGETEYVGSMKSERYARVYRYAAPHPRAGVLRVEHVFRADYAKTVGSALVRASLEEVAAQAGNTFGWLSSSWRPEYLTDGKIRATRGDRHEPGRVRWLFQVCIPALVKAERDGLLSIDELIARLNTLRGATKAAATA